MASLYKMKNRILAENLKAEFMGLSKQQTYVSALYLYLFLLLLLVVPLFRNNDNEFSAHNVIIRQGHYDLPCLMSTRKDRGL